jgi:homoserine O-succinyltransferase
VAIPAKKADFSHGRRSKKVKVKKALGACLTMPIKIPDELPARLILEREGINVMDETHAIRQDIRPMRVALLNLMPNKIQTETQLARLIGATPLQVDLTLVRITDHESRHTPPDHMASFYRPWEAVRNERFDGFIITGAPVERLAFEEVLYWDEMRRILDWTQTNVHRLLTICWAAQAAVHHFHGMPKYELPQKAFGVFRHWNRCPSSPHMRGFADDIAIPVSRWTEVRKEDIPPDSGISVLAESDETGVCLLDDPRNRAVHMFNHVEYDTDTLAREYERDKVEGGAIPKGYFPNNDPTCPPVNHWRGHGHLLFGNWINDMYQTTPYDTNLVGIESFQP